jgi:hypothetical protein
VVRAASCSLWWARVRRTTRPVAAAVATFNTSPHNALHAIDTDLRQVDPLAAASLATAKADAETAIIAGSDDAPDLTRTLAEETAAAYRILEDDDSITACG